jgi:hypothetical protein
MPRDDRDHRLRKLAAHGPERLARALLDLAGHDARAHDVVQRLVTTPAESSARVQRRLDALRDDQRFFDWRSTSAFAEELRSILADIAAATADPREGVELVAAFYRSDRQAFEMADDSGGDIGDVFRGDARELWTGFAKACDDEAWLISMVLELLDDDGYGVRDSILKSASEYLSEEGIRALIAKLRTRTDPSGRATPYAAAALAKQILDPKLFERITRGGHRGELHPAAYAELAHIHLDLDDPTSALDWAAKMPDEGFRAHDKRKLLLEIHERLGNVQQAEAVAWATLRDHRSTQALEDLLQVIGDDQRTHAIDQCLGIIERQAAWSPADACFLVEVARLDDAETYILRNAARLDGDAYGRLVDLAEAMEDDGRWRCASLLYRALLDSILRRAKPRSYRHAAKYLRKLATLAKRVSDWGDLDDHLTYRTRLEAQHARKYAFWRLVTR